MLSDIKRAIIDKLQEEYPSRIIYEDDIPEMHETPSFLIMVTNQVYSKGLNNRYKSVLSFDIAYYSDKSTTDIKSDCYEVQVDLIRAFDIINTYRAINKKVTITENVLHLTFDIASFEMKKVEAIKMQDTQVQTNN